MTVIEIIIAAAIGHILGDLIVMKIDNYIKRRLEDE